MSHIDKVIQRIRHDQEKVVEKVDEVNAKLDEKREEIREEIRNVEQLLRVDKTTEKIRRLKGFAARINSLVEEEPSTWIESICNLPQLPGSDGCIRLY